MSVLGSLGSQASFSTFHPLSILVFSVLSNICSYKWEDLEVIWLFCLGGTINLKQSLFVNSVNLLTMLRDKILFLKHTNKVIFNAKFYIL